ncbi:alpha/beta hydrolase fold protein [Thalassoporum mexicanum PCC 7367]|uniref:alpha/beta fold hydrolase n=1 Tax=Thalassoporum mexicanum TaxID=3457544 RepID=UPI00029FD832|nr:alpha/beta hydrolase [Pseudanabaena sp. PCC 7367]AFY70893.1 alpha/beta hydrolase fold protein [Pseudanabaena sp. PCC 7367]
MPSVIIAGARHNYALTPQTDTPTTLVFLHGWLLSQVYWQPLVNLLSCHYRCLTYDLRGFGRSGVGDRRTYSPACYAQDLSELLDQLEINSAWLVGHSLGGVIALWAASMLSDRVVGVACLNSGGGIYLKEEFEKFRQAGQTILKFRPVWLDRVPLLANQFAKDSVKFPLAKQWGKQRIQDFVGADFEAAKGTLLDSTSAEQVHLLPQVVAKLTQPVYFFAGADDRIMEPKYVNHLASFHYLFNGSGENVFELNDCGHMGMLEQPDRIGQKLLTLLPPPQIKNVA